MSVPRMLRLEQLLGAAPADLTWEHLNQMVSGRVLEAVDLEFKREHYGNSDASKRELAKDVAGMANTVGGIVLIGVDEGADASAHALTSVSLADSEVTRLSQIVASYVSPPLPFNVYRIPDPDNAELGVLILAVGKSAGAPHAVAYANGLRYPRRAETTTQYMTEAEVAEAYHRRFTITSSSDDRAARVEQNTLSELDRHFGWVVLTVVPDTPGYSTIDGETFAAFQSRMMNERAALPYLDLTYEVFGVDSGYMQANSGRAGDANGPAIGYCALHTHSDGAGAAAVALGDLDPVVARGTESATVLSDSDIAAAILGGLARLGEHAWTVGAGGVATIRLRVIGINTMRFVALGRDRGNRPISRWQHPIFSERVVEVHTPVGALFPPGPQLVVAAERILRELGNAFGVPELPHFDRDGSVHLQCWPALVRQSIADWASERGLTTVVP